PVREKVGRAGQTEDLRGVGRVDLVILSEADPFLSANIVRGERLFCRDTYAADEYELYILRRAGDLAPLEMERLSLIFANAR
ncbi:MAG: nucleotidyltransferase domain-containing protein, partial [Syntrophales bacterium LBB04]|nr:nucleotidyltransferase domain-containing protein [Syntrophales bacterium LBB04]